MPGIDGLKICQYARQAGRAYVYVIVLTARTAPDAVVEALRAGADDYVTKPFHERELEVRLRAGRRIVELEDGLRLAANQDALTDLWGRAAIRTYLGQQLSKAQREGSRVAVLMIDLDHFKQINDRHGHATGDAVLLEVAQRMRRTLRSYDGLGRVGGEEFLVVLPNADRAAGLAVAERIRGAVDERPVATAAGVIPVSCSIGVAAALGGEASAEALLERADEALYRAKRAGRNRVESAPGAEPAGRPAPPPVKRARRSADGPSNSGGEPCRTCRRRAPWSGRARSCWAARPQPSRSTSSTSSSRSPSRRRRPRASSASSSSPTTSAPRRSAPCSTSSATPTSSISSTSVTR
jgi:diguanylate cyclase (GGDEF)-like protein